MARAILRLFPGAKLAFGPTTANGFYYDVDLPEPAPLRGRLPRDRGRDGHGSSRTPSRSSGSASPSPDARQFVDDLGQAFKVEHIDDELHKYGVLSFYRQGEFVDLCRGPHIPHAGKVGAFKLLSIAGAYWKGHTDRPMLQRVYGTAFFDKKDLDAYLAQVEEAKKRDHRKLGKELGLFTISPLVGSGLILWMPKGAIVRGVLENFLKDELIKRGYQPVYTPHIGKIELYQTSGHYPYYKDSQFPVLRMLDDAAMALVGGPGEGRRSTTPAQKVLLAKAGIPESMPRRHDATSRPTRGVDYWSLDKAGRIKYVEEHGVSEEYLLKPMNCPHHIQIYAAQPRSYRDLPVRLAEFGTVYRYEQSGELSGLTRVRGFTQDDAHLFCTAEQVRGEFRATMELTQFVLEQPRPDRLPAPALEARPRRPQVPGGRGRHLAAGRGRHPLRARRDGPALRGGPRRGGVLRARRPTSSSATASAGSGSSARCSSTTSCPSGSAWSTPGPTTTRTGR